MKQFFCLGTYTEPILFGTGEVFQGKGKGVSICSFEDGKIETLTTLPVRNPSFVAIDEEQRKIYAVNEMKEYGGAFGGGLTQIGYEPDGTMQIEADFNTAGTDPCHVRSPPTVRSCRWQTLPAARSRSSRAMHRATCGPIKRSFSMRAAAYTPSARRAPTPTAASLRPTAR